MKVKEKVFKKAELLVGYLKNKKLSKNLDNLKRK